MTWDRGDLVRDHFETTADQWRDLYSRRDLYAHIYQQRRELVSELIDSLELTAPERVLEVGPGPGFTTIELARRGHSVYALDLAPAMLEMTRQLASDSGVRVKTVLGQVRGLPFADHTFRLVLAVGVTEWVGALQQAVDQLARVVAPKGHLIITTDNRWALYRLLDPALHPILDPLKKLLRQSDRKARSTVHSIGQFNAAIKKAGLHVVSGVTLGFGPFSFVNHQPLPVSLAIRIHERLQRAADRGAPLLRKRGHVYAVLARK